VTGAYGLPPDGSARVPAVKTGGGVRNDHSTPFVLDALERRGPLTSWRAGGPGPARRRLRRVEFRPTGGLAADAQEVEDFLAGRCPRRLRERRWDRPWLGVAALTGALGRHWLGLGRYAGLSEVQSSTPTTPRRRLELPDDYVVRAFNADQGPMTAFSGQIAGDG